MQLWGLAVRYDHYSGRLGVNNSAFIEFTVVHTVFKIMCCISVLHVKKPYKCVNKLCYTLRVLISP